MDNVQNLILDALRGGTMTGTNGTYTWECPKTDDNWSAQWVMSLSVAPYNPEVHQPWFITWLDKDDPDYEEELAESTERIARMTEEEGTPTHMARVVFRTEWDDGMLQLVDGTELYLRVDESTGTVTSVWDEVWEGNQPDYYGGPIPEAREWVNELEGTTGEYYLQLDNPFSK